jgi:hypothetical protein
MPGKFVNSNKGPLVFGDHFLNVKKIFHFEINFLRLVFRDAFLFTIYFLDDVSRFLCQQLILFILLILLFD